MRPAMSCTRHRAAAGRPFQALAPQKGPGTLLARSPFRPLPYTLALAMLAGFALGAIAVERLHAQVKPKAFTVAELETLDAATQATYVPAVLAAQKAAGGHPLNTGGGKIVAMDGAPAPKRVPLPSGTALSRRKHSTSRRPGMTWGRSATRHRRPYDATSSSPRTRRRFNRRSATKPTASAEAAWHNLRRHLTRNGRRARPAIRSRQA
jgi:hypothetical protein